MTVPGRSFLKQYLNTDYHDDTGTFNSVQDRLTRYVGYVLLFIIYSRAYWTNPAVPSPASSYPEGWWGWFDQSKYLASAKAFATLNFSAAEHWYPAGYALLGAPFSWIGPHSYYLPDLLCLLVTAYAYFSFAAACGIGPVIALPLFLLGTCGSESIRSVWAEPWNTSLSSALIWLLLLLVTRLFLLSDKQEAPRPRRLKFLFLGMLCVLIPVTRPTDAIIVAICGAISLASLLIYRKFDLVDLLSIAFGGGLMLGIFGALYLRIYGPHPSEYMIISHNLGFRRAYLGWKIYLLLITPRPWFPDGAGILQRLPWLAPGIVGIFVSPLMQSRGKALPYLLLSLLILSYSLMFFSYVDLIPSGLWRYHNLHYFKWAFPALTLLGYAALRSMVGPLRLVVIGVSIAAFALSCVRILPTRAVSDQQPIWMLTFAEPEPSWPDVYFSTAHFTDARSELHNINEFRAVTSPHGERWIALARPFENPLQLDKSHAPVPTVPWTRQLRFRLDPCWLPPYACDHKDPLP